MKNDLKDILKGRKTAVIGRTQEAEDFIRDFAGKIQVDCLLVSDSRMDGSLEYFCVDGKEVCPVYQADTVLRKKEHYFILCTQDYFEREEGMGYYGLAYGQDYMDAGAARCLLTGKKIAVSYGICYVRAVMDCLRTVQPFMDEYEVYSWVSYKPMTAFAHSMFLYMVSICDLYVYNDCISDREQKKNAAFLSRTKPGCRRISIPIIEFRGYHPQTLQSRGKDNPFCVTSRRTSFSPFLSPDCNINGYLEKGMTADRILELVSGEDFYTEEELESILDKQWKTVAFYEAHSDITICDYLRRMHGKERLFFNERHMTNTVIIELARRILAALGMAERLPADLLLCKRLLYTTEVPLYPSVIKHFRLDNYGERPVYELFSFQKTRRVTFEEYVYLYCDFCGHMKRYMDQGFFPRESMGWNVAGGGEA